MTSRRLASSVAVATVGLACSVGSLDLSGKLCPCTDGFVCDVDTGVCVATASDAAPLPTGSPPDGGLEDRGGVVDSGSGRIVVFGLKPTWQTPNGIRWDWRALGDAKDFARYEVITGPTAEAVRARRSGTRVFDATSNPELASFGGRAANAGAPPVPLWTVTDGHDAGTTVFAQVVAYDTAGGTTVSDVASAVTTRARAMLALYDDDAPSGGVLAPGGTKVVTENPFDGPKCLERTASCDGGSCDEEMGVRSIDGAFLDKLDSTDFDGAFLEIAVRGTRVPSRYLDLVLALGADSCAAACRMRFGGVSFGPAPGEWRLLQIPLRSLKRNDGAGAGLNYAELSNRNFRANSFYLIGAWPDASKVGIDRVRVRW